MTELEHKLIELGLKEAIPIANDISPLSKNSKLNVYLVGGCVRDALLNRPYKDFDICVSGDKKSLEDVGDFVYQKLSEKTKLKYEIDVKKSGFNGGLRKFLQNCGGGILMTFLLYLSGKTDIEPIIFPRFLVGMTKINGEDMEFVATRSEDYTTTEGLGSRERNPGEVSIASEYEDSIRRDFTVNALYVNLSSGELLDPTGYGLTDLKNKTIRVTRSEDPRKVFEEDPLRILRAIRQSIQLGFKIEKGTYNVIRDLIIDNGEKYFGENGSLSKERIRDEISKILLTNNPDDGLRLLSELKVLDVIMPDISRMVYDKEKGHKNIWDHTLNVVKNINITPEIESAIENTADKLDMDPNILRSKILLRLRLSALFHDSGKIPSKTYGEMVCPNCNQKTQIKDFFEPLCENCNSKLDVKKFDKPRFDLHQFYSEKIAKKILSGLKFDSQMVKWISRDCALHQVSFDQYLDKGKQIQEDVQLRDSPKVSVEKLVNDLEDRNPTAPDIWDELNFAVRMYGLIRSDSSASLTSPTKQENRVDKFIREYEEVKKKREEEKTWQEFNKPILSGDDIMKMFNVKPGRWIGNIIKQIREEKLKDPENHTEEKEIEIAKNELNKWGPEIYNQEVTPEEETI